MNRTDIENALLNKYATKINLVRNKDWNWEEEDSEENCYYFEIPIAREKQLNDQPWVVYKADDGYNSMYCASIKEIVDTIMEYCGQE